MKTLKAALILVFASACGPEATLDDHPGVCFHNGVVVGFDAPVFRPCEVIDTDDGSCVVRVLNVQEVHAATDLTSCRDCHANDGIALAACDTRSDLK
jgi:hypothetical protein